MMNTFHIGPTDALAPLVLDEVMAFAPDALVAIRGQVVDGEETVYTVSECPDPDHTWKYVWSYVEAGQWLAEYDKF